MKQFIILSTVIFLFPGNTGFTGKIVIPGTGKADFNPDGITHGFRFACAHTLSSRFSLGYNLGMNWDGAPEGFISFGLSWRIPN